MLSVKDLLNEVAWRGDIIKIYDSKKSWTKAFIESEMAYPAEYVIRIFKGKYPRLHLSENSFEGKKICDVGCGDGRNLVLLKQCGFDVYGVEITEDIVDKVKSNLHSVGVDGSGIKVGANDNIPFGDKEFDYLLSWNACYYMGESRDFSSYVREFARVLKEEGHLILSIPKTSCFIYHGSEDLGNGYFMIKNDPFNIRNGEVLKGFKSEQEIIEAFSEYFENFVYGSVQDDCFGFDYHWHLVVCKRKADSKKNDQD